MAEETENIEEINDTLDTKEQDTNPEETVSEEKNLAHELSLEKEKHLRLFAEFENYKKRTSKERMDLYKTANKEVILALVPVLDDFERGFKEISKSEDKKLVTGVELIQQKLSQILSDKGLKKIEVKQGDDFNTDFHEAITQIPAPTEDLKNKIIDTIETGYTLNEKVIRFVKVVVGN